MRLPFLECTRQAAGLSICAVFLPLTTLADTAPGGEAVYKKRCAACHDQINTRIPPRQALEQMSSARILRALDAGAMMAIAFTMHRDERVAVASYLGAKTRMDAPPASAFCSDRTVKLSERTKFSWNGWSTSSANARFQSADGAGLNLDQVSRLKLKWAFGFEGDVTAFAPPSAIDGQLFVGSAAGIIHAMRAETGCLQWVYQANGPVRSSIVSVSIGRRHALLFGDMTGWFYSLEAETGKLLWKVHIETHDSTRLTGAPVVSSGTVYVPVASWEETRASDPEYPCCTLRETSAR